MVGPAASSNSVPNPHFFSGTASHDVSPSHLRNFVETALTLRSYGQFAQGSGAFDLPIRKLSYEQFVLGSASADFVIWPYESGSPSRRNFVDSWDWTWQAMSARSYGVVHAHVRLGRARRPVGPWHSFYGNTAPPVN